MARFRVGDVVELVNDGNVSKPHNIAAVGLEATVTSRAKLTLMHDWEVLASDGARYNCKESCMRLKRPPSWDQWLYDTSGITPDVTLAVSSDGGRTWNERA